MAEAIQCDKCGRFVSKEDGAAHDWVAVSAVTLLDNSPYRDPIPLDRPAQVCSGPCAAAVLSERVAKAEHPDHVPVEQLRAVVQWAKRYAHRRGLAAITNDDALPRWQELVELSTELAESLTLSPEGERVVQRVRRARSQDSP